MSRFLLVLLLAALGATAWAAAPTLKIANPLGLDWPWELVHWDLPAADVPAGDISVKMGDITRPAQVEAIPDDDKHKRVWFIATIKGGEKEATVTLVPGATASPLTLKEDADFLTVSNGIYDFRVPRYAGQFAKPTVALPPVAGFRLKDDPAGWYGRSWFTTGGKYPAARTTIVSRGPIFIRVDFIYGNMADPEVLGAMDSPWGSTLRFVVGDPWVEVNEGGEWGHGHALELKDNLKPDTVMWVPWFGFKGFGGNNSLKFHPVQPQEMQRGPFVALQPKWTQNPGAGQDFFVTRGGDTKTNPDPETPAVGVVAIHASEWNPAYEQIIRAYAENGDTARLEFPASDMAGSRSYAICIGPRKLFDNTGKLNNFIRRHSDWTLDDQIHKYILEWERKPELAGPHILMTAAELKAVQDDYKADKDTAQVRALKAYVARRAELKGRDLDVLKLLIGEPVGAPGAPSASQWINTRYQDDFLNPTTNTRRIKDAFPWADLFSGGKPMGNGWTAAAGYIFSDLDQWPGYHNGWWPGNPNFHTDKYSVALFAGASMPDHPHAKDWLKFGKDNFDEDTTKVLSTPDGVGFECPGYSTYSLGLQLELARVLKNAGMGNPVVDNPMFKATGIWHRKLLTPSDPRWGYRHQAPIGDTHRFGLADGNMFGKLGTFYKDADPKFASEMLGIWKLFREAGMNGDLLTDVVHIDQGIPQTPVEKMDWSSQAFKGFGTIMRSRFGTPRETFVTLKAGDLRGHYHNEELAYHFYGAGAPISLDYNCSYHPRGDHAALHNSITFGKEEPYTHSGTAKPVEAMEQLTATAQVKAFATTPAADMVIAERSGNALVLTPTYPDDAIFGYGYPRRDVKPITHRRTLVLVKHPEGSALEDYLVVRDDTTGEEPTQLNIHLLSREITRDGNLIRATGQWGADATVYLAKLDEAAYRVGRWFYYDENAKGPNGEPKDEWRKTIHDTDGKALTPPADWTKSWTPGEYQQWLKIGLKPGTSATWVLYPRKRGTPEPTFATLPNGAVRVTLAQETDEIALDGTQAVVRVNGKETVVR